MNSDKPAGAITADDVARLAGVSRWTVHRAFKADASISRKSRDKVRAAADALGYVPDLLAVSLASQRSGIVALLIDDFDNPQQTTMVSHLAPTLRQSGWQSLLVYTQGEADAASALLQASQHRVDAAVLIGGQFDDERLGVALGAQRLKRLIAFGRYSENPGTVSICCDDAGAMRQLIDHLLARGYQRPLYLAGPKTLSVNLMRQEATHIRWKEATGTVPEVLAVETYTPDLAYARVLAHFEARSAPRPDVLICETDALALGAMDALRHGLGLRVPEDVAVTGFDDVDAARNPNYALTTYRQPNQAMADAVVAVLQGAEHTQSFARMTGALMVRKSA